MAGCWRNAIAHPTRPGRCKLGYWVPTPDR